MPYLIIAQATHESRSLKRTVPDANGPGFQFGLCWESGNLVEANFWVQARKGV